MAINVFPIPDTRLYIMQAYSLESLPPFIAQHERKPALRKILILLHINISRQQGCQKQNLRVK